MDLCEFQANQTDRGRFCLKREKEKRKLWIWGWSLGSGEIHRKDWGRVEQVNRSLKEMSPDDTPMTQRGSTSCGIKPVGPGWEVRDEVEQEGVDLQALTVREEAGAEGDVSDTIS